MAFQQLQTAAVRIFFLANPTDRDLAKVQASFPLHPHDAEAILGFANHSQAEHFGSSTILRLPWVIYHQADNDLVTTELDVLWQDQNLVIVSKGDIEAVQETLDEVMGDASAQRYTAPLEVIAELLWRMTSQAIANSQPFLKAVAPTIQDEDSLHWQRINRQSAQAIEDILTRTSTNLPESLRLRLKLIAHQLHHLRQRLANHPRQVTRPVDVPTLMLPKLASGYLVVSAVVILLVLVATAG